MVLVDVVGLEQCLCVTLGEGCGLSGNGMGL